MIKNYLRIAFRTLWKHRTYSFLNIMGLSIGMAACFLIFQYVRFERSYDTFHTKADRIYRLVTDFRLPSGTFSTSGTSAPMGINIQTDFPQVESASYAAFWHSPGVSYNNLQYAFSYDDVANQSSTIVGDNPAYCTLYFGPVPSN